jgi:hypothetical protein
MIYQHKLWIKMCTTATRWAETRAKSRAVGIADFSGRKKSQ